MRSLAASPTPTLATLSSLSPDAVKLLALSVPSFMYLLYRMCEMDDVDAARCTQDSHQLESPVRQRRKSSSATTSARRRSSGVAVEHHGGAKAKSPTSRGPMDDAEAGVAEQQPGSVTASPIKTSCSAQANAMEQHRPFVSRHVRAAFATRTDSGLDILASLQSPLSSSVPASATIVGPSP